MGLFGTSGVRGVTGKEITPDLVERVVCGFIRVLENSGSKGKVCIAHDTRMCADTFARIASNHIVSHGWKCETLGVQPAGVICNYILKSQCRGGVFITGSHLREGYIGVILLDEGAGYIGGAMANQIEDSMKDKCVSRRTGKITDMTSSAVSAYYELVSSIFPEKVNLHISIDPCCGSAAEFASRLMQDAGLKVSSINDYRSDKFPRDPEPRSESTVSFQEHVRDSGADFGAAYDIDADRVLIIDEKGQPILEDILGVFLAKHMLRRGESCTAPINSSLLIEDVCRKMGIRFEYCGIGQPNIVAKMREMGASYAYEESGKYYVKRQPFACGILTTLAVAEVVFSSGKQLSDHVREFPKIFMWKKGFECPNEIKKQVMEDIVSRWGDVIRGRPVNVITIDGVKKVYSDGSWVMIRASGTEPKIRIYLEGKNETRRDELASSAERLVCESLERCRGR